MGADEGAKILGAENLKRFLMGKFAFLKCMVICFLIYECRFLVT